MVTLEELKISLADSDPASQDPIGSQCTPGHGAPATPDVAEPWEAAEASAAQDALDREHARCVEEVGYENEAPLRALQ